MIKGCSKKVIVMHETGCDMIEEAFFILKAGAETGKVKQGDILKHAQKILKNSEYNEKLSALGMNVMSRGGRKTPYQFIFGTIFGAICAMTIMFIL